MSELKPTFDRGRPNRLQKLFFRGPIALYRGLPAEIMKSRCVMLLTTTGRRSGQPRTTGVSFMPLDGRYIIFSGWGVQSDWYRNLLANPEATIQMGKKRIPVKAVPVADPERRKALMRQMRARSAQCGPPEPLRTGLRAVGIFDYDAELDMAIAQGEALPVIELIPTSASG